jgi:hypothetical protein
MVVADLQAGEISAENTYRNDTYASHGYMLVVGVQTLDRTRECCR